MIMVRPSFIAITWCFWPQSRGRQGLANRNRGGKQMSEVDLKSMGQRAVAAGHQLGLVSAEVRDGALEEIALRLLTVSEELWEANRLDLAEAREAGLSPALIDRSTLTPRRIASMAQGCRDVAALSDPLGEMFDGRTLPNGLQIARVRVPLGVLGVIFESRPNVTIDISALCIKTGNAVIMRGGKESLRTNMILIDLVRGDCE